MWFFSAWKKTAVPALAPTMNATANCPVLTSPPSPTRNRLDGAFVVQAKKLAHGGEKSMGIGVSLILIAAGAILTWAVNATVSGLSIHTIGVILMVVGLVGLVLSVMFWSSWGGFAGARRTTVVEGAPVTRRRRTVVEDEAV